MEFKVGREEFYKTVSRVQNIIERRSTMPILSTILFTTEGDTLSASATDLEVGLRQELPAEIITEGSTTISGRKIFEILRESNRESIHIKKNENNWVFVTDGSAKYNLSSLPADEFPDMAQPEDLDSVEIDGNLISEMIDKTIYAVTAEDAGYKLSGIYTETINAEDEKFLRMVATDGHRLSLIEKKVKNIDNLEISSGIMIPKKAMFEINRLGVEPGSIFLAVKGKYCIASKNKLRLNVRLLESKFPDYRAVIPKDTPLILNIQRQILLEAMRRMLILSNDKYRAVKVTLEEGRMDLMSTNPDLGNAQESIPVDYRGEKIEAGFNPRFFVDTFQVMESNNVTLGFKDESKPCVIKGEADEGFLALMMPMRL